MRPIQYETSSLETLFARQRIATLPELKGALGTDVYITVVRKLRPLGYLCSYSHGGKFYTLEKLAQFDQHGLLRWAARASRGLARFWIRRHIG